MKPKSINPLAAIALASAFTTYLHAATGTWTGAPAATWDTTATNWSGVAGTPWDSTNGGSNLTTFNTLGATPAVGGTVFTNGITFSNTATISGGTINLAGATAVTVNANATIGSVLDGTSGLTKAGNSTLTLTGANIFTGATSVNAGNLTVSGTGSLSSAGNLTVSTASTSPSVTYSSSANSTLGAISVGTGNSRTGTFTQSGGIINASSVSLATGQNSGGNYNLSNGTLALTGALGVGTRSGINWFGVFNLSGTGTLTTTSLNVAPVSGGGNSFGRFDISGGTASIAGSLNLTTGAPADSTGRLAICTLRGGQLSVNGVNTGSFSGTAYSAALLNFAGGTLVANTPNANFISGLTTAYIYGGIGATIDSNGNDVTISNTLHGTSASGVTSVGSIVGGTGYPASRVNLAVTFSAPDTSPGRTAQGYAITNASGVVTSIAVTDPGTGYSSAPTIDAIAGGGTGADGTVSIGLPTNITSTGGGLTKKGLGILTLAGANTYTGATLVEDGTLALSSPDQLSNTAGLLIDAGSIVQLDYVGDDTVGGLSLGGVYQPAGIWGALGSGAPNESALITGTGRINNTNTSGQFYWDGGGANWGVLSSWSFDQNSLLHNPAVLPDADSVVNFGATPLASDQTVNLAADRTARGLAFLGPVAYTLTGGGVNRQLTIGSNGITASASADDVTIGSATSGQQVAALVSGNQTWTNQSAATVTFANGVDLGADTVTVGGAGPITIGGGLSASSGGTFRKLGTGTLTLTGTDTLASDKNIDNGTFAISGNHSAATGSIVLRGYGDSGTTYNTVSSTANLEAASSVTVDSAKTIQAGNTTASGGFQLQTLNANGPLTNDGSLFVGRSGRINVGGAWTQNGSATVATQGGGLAVLTVNSTGSFIHAAGGDFILRSSGSTNTLTDVIVDGGTFTTGTRIHNDTVAVTSGSSSGIVLKNGGTLKLSAGIADLFTTDGATRRFVADTGGGVVNTNSFSTTLNVPVSGTGGITKSGGGTLTLAELNTYSGNTKVTGGILKLAQANDSNETSTITIDLGAKIDIAFSGNDTVQALVLNNVNVPAGSYNSSHPTYGSFFDATGTGSIVVVPAAAGYASWITTPAFGLAPADQDPNDDPDNDGMDNLLEFVLNGNPSVSDSSIMPDPVVTATAFEFTYQRRDDSVSPETTQTFQWGTTLATWPGSVSISPPIASLPAMVTITPGSPSDAVTDTVKISIPKTEAGDSGKLFGRLQVVKP